jgi:hypothetical protein
MADYKERPSEETLSVATETRTAGTPSREQLGMMTPEQIDALAEKVWENLTGLKAIPR